MNRCRRKTAQNCMDHLKEGSASLMNSLRIARNRMLTVRYQHIPVENYSIRDSSVRHSRSPSTLVAYKPRQRHPPLLHVFVLFHLKANTNGDDGTVSTTTIRKANRSQQKHVLLIPLLLDKYRRVLHYHASTLQQFTMNLGRSVRSLNSGYSLQGTTHSGNTTAPFDGSSESDRENNEVFARSTPAFSRTSATPPHQESNFTPNDAVSVLNNKKGPERHHIRRAADERLQRGLESSLTPHEIRNRINPTKRSDLLAGKSDRLQIQSPSSRVFPPKSMFYYSAVGSNNGMGQPSTSAIDSKIEQAMDLVKTHLMFAVREELDVLRGKITELESHIYRLETENAVFKANIPSDVLRNLSLDQSN
ncbi:hypothetical protein V3C99_017630 [Haemonchus contortus]